MNLFYENHLGEKIHFYHSPYILTSHDFFDWLMSFSTVGNRSTAYRLNAVERQFTVQIMPRQANADARLAEYADLIDAFNDITSKDTNTTGKLWTDNGEYIDCQIYSVAHSDWNIARNVTLTCRMRVDKPMWQRPKDYSFEPVSEFEYDWLDYPYDFEYDFKATLPGFQTVENTGTEPCAYILTIYGSSTAPVVWFNGLNRVGASVTLGSAEKLIVNTQSKTVIKVSNGQEISVFDKRFKDAVSMFEPLPVGVTSLQWSGLFAFDVTLLEERRSPRWN